MTTNRNIAPAFTLNLTELRRIPRKYARYTSNEEVPVGSLALVGYTMGTYEKDGQHVLTPNLNWVVVLATDD